MKKLALFSLVLLVAGCAKYRPTHLPHPAGERYESNGVIVIARKLTPGESKNCFDSRALNEKYDAIQLYIQNKTNKRLVLGSTNISMPIVSKKDVCKLMYRNTVGRAGGYGVVGILLFPIFLIPAAVDGAKSSSANHKIDIDVRNKVFGQNETLTILPHDSINKIIFVPKRTAKREFDLTVTTQDLTLVAKFTCRV